MRTGIVTQARMTSTRLPGKVLKTVAGKTLLQHQLDRLRRAKADEIIVATTTNADDDPIVELCRKLAVPYFRGSEHDVLARYDGAAKTSKLDLVVRVTSDCPLIDPSVIDRVIAFRSDKYDYASNTVTRSYPRGMDTEVFSADMLDQAAKNGKKAYEREHVTPYFYKRPEIFRIGQVVYHRDESARRWTVDTPEDFALIEKLLTELKPGFTLEDALALIAKHPDWSALNAHVEQKKL